MRAKGLLSRLLFATGLASSIGAAWASDACSDYGIIAHADVTVSDGSSFSTEAYYHSANTAAIRHLGASDQTIAVEGPVAWVQVGEEAELGGDFHKVFALGHQYHALLENFDAIVPDVRDTAQSFRGQVLPARSGEYPYGGAVHLVGGRDSPPLGLVFEFPDAAPIEVVFSEWRTVGGKRERRERPYRAEIHDGERVFDYSYTKVENADRSPLWFVEALPAPSLDELRVYRLHRALLAAHCLGDAQLMADLSAENVVIANRGQLSTTTRTDMRDRFAQVFERVDYTEYHDLMPPEVRVSETGDIGWIGVNVRAVGIDRQSGVGFDDQWAWLMTVQKIDGRWLHTANASNIATDPR
ncbi:MAG: hypothetical protein AAF417_17680 [Pseudomonadota bacterium]